MPFHDVVEYRYGQKTIHELSILNVLYIAISWMSTAVSEYSV